MSRKPGELTSLKRELAKVVSDNEKLKSQAVELASQLESSRNQCDGLDVMVDGLRKARQEEIQQSMEHKRLQKTLLVIGHISAGRHDQAISEILSPEVHIFKLEVRFANDATREKAESEMLERLKRNVITTVGGITIERKPEAS